MIRVDPAHIATGPAPAGRADAPETGPRTLVERQVAMLTRLAEMGMEIAEAATRAATAAAEPLAADAEPPFRGDPVLAYTRAARAVRQAFALQTQLLKDLAALEAGEAAAEAKRTDARRARLRRLASRALEAEGLGGAALGRLSSKVWERLHDAEDAADLLGLPFAEAVAAICHELGLAPEWTAQMVAAAGEAVISHRREDDGGSTAEGREGGEGAIPASRPAPPAPSTAYGGPPPPLREGGSSDDTVLEWPPP